MSVSSTTAVPQAEAVAQTVSLTVDLLVRQVERGDGAGTLDPGVPVLAALLDHVAPDHHAAAVGAVQRWLATARAEQSHPGLFGSGVAGFQVGLAHAAAVVPELDGRAEQLAPALVRGRLSGPPPFDAPRVFPHYDLVTGPVGTLLALCAAAPCKDSVGGRPAGVPAGLVDLARRLASWCGPDDALGHLRLEGYSDHPDLHWLQGHVNAGLAHGVPGLAAALTTALRRIGPDEAVTGALRRTTRWLVANSLVDARGVRTWVGTGLHPGVPRDRALPRQAWCYGTPGVGWALWDAADVLDDEELAAFAGGAFASLAEVYESSRYAYGEAATDRLAVCHGRAGTLAVADAFARHAGLPAARELADLLLRELLAELPVHAEELRREESGLPNGLSGVLAVVLTVTHGAGTRGWLPVLALR